MSLSAFSKNINPAVNFIPKYRYHVSPRIVSFEEKKLLAVIRLSGIPFESIDEELIENRFNNLNGFFAALTKEKSARLAAWTYLFRRKADFSQQYEFESEFMKKFAAKYIKRFEKGDYYENTFHVALVLKYDDLDDGIEELEELIDFVIKSLLPYGPEALEVYTRNKIEFSEVYTFLGELINGVREEIPVLSSPAADIIPSSWIHFNYEVHEARADNTTRYFTCYDLKDFPDTCESGLFNPILTLKAEFTLAQSFICMSPYASQKAIDDQINKLTSVGDKAVHQTKELTKAKGYISSGELAFGDYHAALVVYGDTDQKAKDAGTTVITTFLGQCGARFIKATGSSMYTYLSQMPGYLTRPRPMPKASRNIAAAFGMHNYSTGKSRGNPIGDGSAIIPLETRSKSVFNFNFHYSKLDVDSLGLKIAGHTLILGATGAGKTTLQLTLLGFLERFNPKIFAVDKDRGMELFIRNLGGTYFPLKAGIPTGLNPFQLPDTPKNREFLYDLVTTCGRDENGKVSSAEEQQIKTAVDTIFGLEFNKRRFSRLLESIPDTGENCLAHRLHKWCFAEKGRHAWCLDNPTNVFDPYNFWRVGFDVTDLLKKDYEPTEPVLAYLFHLKDLMQEKGGLLATVVEEFWLPAKYETTQEKMLDSLKTGRKEDEFIILVSQSPGDAIGCPIFEAIRDQTPTKIYLPNPAADFESYQKCHLTKKEFDELKKLELESRVFLVKQGNQSAFASLDLSGFNDELAIISGSADNIALAEEIMAEFGEDPAKWMPIFQDRRHGARSK